MTRTKALLLIQYAGYHDDTETALRAALDGRVAHQKMKEAWRKGVRARAKGVRCGCYDCMPAGGG